MSFNKSSLIKLDVADTSDYKLTVIRRYKDNMDVKISGEPGVDKNCNIEARIPIPKNDDWYDYHFKDGKSHIVWFETNDNATKRIMHKS